MRRQHRSRRCLRPPADAIEQEDLWQLSGTFNKASGRRGAGRKTLQLCSQVADTLNYVFSGDCDDDLLRNLHVLRVLPAPDASQLLVTVCPVVSAGADFDVADVLRRLAAASGRLRAEVASSITRKKAPKLLFQFAGPVGDGAR